MNMVRHHSVCMQFIVAQDVGVVVDSLDDHVCNGTLPQVERAATSFIQQSVKTANACPELSLGSGKHRLGGRLPCRRQVRKTGRFGSST